MSDPTPTLPAHIEAYEHTSGHRLEIEASSLCGCFYCFAMMSPGDIVSWIDAKTTALCPKCGIDSIIGDASKFTINPAFLARMHAHWFKGPPS